MLLRQISDSHFVCEVVIDVNFDGLHVFEFGGYVLRRDICNWMSEFMRDEFVTVGGSVSEAVLRFASNADAYHFRLRWSDL